MVTFILNKDGSKAWQVEFHGVVYLCVNQDVANELGKLFRTRSIKVKTV